MIILTASEKGGTGKSVICDNLAALRAIQGHKVIILDTDKQATSIKWVLERKNNEFITHQIDCQAVFGFAIIDKIEEFKAAYTDIFIDTRGADSEELRAALSVADYLISTLKPTQYDLWTAPHIATLFAEAKTEGINPNIQGSVVLNMAEANTPEIQNAIDFLNTSEFLKANGVVIHNRVSFTRSQSLGGSIFEAKVRDKKAENEIIDLYKVVFNDKENRDNISSSIQASTSRIK